AFRANTPGIAMIPIAKNWPNKPILDQVESLMPRFIRSLPLIVALFLSPALRADVSPETARKLHETVTPSLVAVQYTWEYEFGKVDFVAEGVVVSTDGLIVMHLAAISPQIPDAQLTDFKIIVPRVDKDDEELDASFQGR